MPECIINNIRNNIHIYICKQLESIEKDETTRWQSNYQWIVEKQEFGKLSQSQRRIFEWSTARGRRLIIIKEEQISC